MADEKKVSAEGPQTAGERVKEIRALACVETLLVAFKQAQNTGGPNAKMHVGDVVKVIEAFQSGAMDKGAPVTGPFYPRDHQ